MQSSASPSVAAAVCVSHCTLRRALARDVELDSRLYRRAPGSVVARGCQIGFAWFSFFVNEYSTVATQLGHVAGGRSIS